MDISRIKTLIPDYAKDLRLNLSSVLTPEGAPGLSPEQILATGLASSAAARNETLLHEIEALAADRLDPAAANVARAAAAIMGMNNIYYRFTHLVGNDEYTRLPTKLRMNVIANPGVEKRDFELYSMAVSAVNGCGACMASHERVVRKGGISAEGVQSAIRIAAVIHAVAVAIEVGRRPSESREAA
jgi:alkyl hydroperoxide reductase subunit D